MIRVRFMELSQVLAGLDISQRNDKKRGCEYDHQ